MTQRREFVVYLSSTLADLKEEREIALKTIGEVGVVRTSYRADEKGAVAACTGDVRASDLYVGILAQRYGYVPPQAEDNPASKSITELEYEACVRPGMPPIPRLMFIKSPEAGIATGHIDALAHKETAARMEAFLERANQEQVACQFKNLEEFRAELRIRVREKADSFHRSDAGERGIFVGARWKRQLQPLAMACVPGTDAAQQAVLGTQGGERIRPFELSPADPAYLAVLDRELSLAQLVAFLLTPASLARIISSGAVPTVKAGIDMLLDRCGEAIFITEGIAEDGLPPEWGPMTGPLRQFALPAGALTAPDTAAALETLYQRIRAFAPRLTREARLALPYMVIAPTQEEALGLADPAGPAFAGFPNEDVKRYRRGEFARIAEAARTLGPQWPTVLYGAQRHDWRCFGAASQSVDDIVRHAVARLNDAASGSREKRFLKSARLIPRRYRLEEFLEDRLGSRQAVLTARDTGCLFLVDELALLHPRLRAAADELLVGSRSAIVAMTPCDPSHSRTDMLLGEFSFLRVGSLLARFKTELDPRCEIALNNVERLERWLRATLPELVASAEDQESVPALGDMMVRLLAQ